MSSSSSSGGSGGGGGICNGLSNGSGHSKKIRRRVPTMTQRRAANIRERRRMFSLNESFDQLRRKVRRYLISLHYRRGGESEDVVIPQYCRARERGIKQIFHRVI